MTQQEIKKAIENGESIWVPYNNQDFEFPDYNKVLELCKDNTVKIVFADGSSFPIGNFKISENGVSIRLPDNEFNTNCFIVDVFTTKAEAEHYLHHANITRTETLPFFTWKDIEIQMKNMESFGLNRNDRVLARIITKDSIYYFKLCKDFDLFTFQLKQTYIGEDLCEQIRDKFPVSLGEATEANFYKAYDECVRLFKGEE